MRYIPDDQRRKRFRWTEAADDELRSFYRDGYVVSMIALRMNTTKSIVKNRIHTLRLKRNIFRRPFTALEKKIVRQKYANTATWRIARELGRTICSIHKLAKKEGMKKSQEFMQAGESGRIRKGANFGSSFRFHPGHVPSNKGLRRPGWHVGRMQETQFKKGQRPQNYFPVGTIKANADGYLRIKISDAPEPPGQKGANSPNWEFVHRRVWEAAHGPIPKGHRIWWKDGNHQNCAIENLELLSDQEHMARTTIHTLPKELKDTIMLAGRLKRRIRKVERDKKQTLRSA